MAFVIVQHLSPDFKSLMDELLARHTELPIHLVENGMPVEADHVYLIPPKKEMIISGGRLLLSERDRQQERTLPIDLFFRSLAQDCGPRAVAIVLSGGGSDGSRGILDVHQAGGLVIVQDVDSAQFDGMPRTAADSGVAHWVLAPQDMPPVLAEHAAGRTRRAQAQGGSAPRPRSPTMAWARCTRCSRRSSASTSPTTSRAPSPVASSAGSPSPIPGTSRSTSGVSKSERERARRALSRSAHRRHPLLPRRAGVRGARRTGPSRAPAARAS